MEFSNITSKLGDNLNMWQRLLLDIKLVYIALCYIVLHCDKVLMMITSVLLSDVHIFDVKLYILSETLLTLHHTCICLFVCLFISYYYRKSRRTIDTTETSKVFGPVEIHFGKVKYTNNIPIISR